MFYTMQIEYTYVRTYTYTYIYHVYMYVYKITFIHSRNINLFVITNHDEFYKNL